MRVLAASLLLVAACARAGIAASPTETVSPDAAHAGCLHTDLRACMVSLGSAFWFDMNLVTAQIARRNELDVNGQTAHRRIIIIAKLPGHRETLAVTVTLASPAPNDQVVKISLNLPEDPQPARTESEYDRTQLYDAVAVVLGDRCPGLDKLALYRFYENSLKPAQAIKTDRGKRGVADLTTQTVDTGKLSFCGALFSLHRAAQWYGPPDASDRVIRKALAQGRLTIDIE